MPRLTDPDPASFPDDVRQYLTTLPPDPMVKMLSHSAGTVKPFVELARAQVTAQRLPARSRELVILTVAACTECAFVAAQHEPVAQSAGVDETTLRLIRAGDLDNPAIALPDRALIRLAAEVVRHPRVSDEVFGLARSFLSEREFVEVLQVVGYYWSFARIATVLDVEVTRVYRDGEVLDTPADTGTAEVPPASMR
ncbi:carboxymuconolactone decarboxylase family protein [Actinacidiphila glaucinigra]|uniref:carboxymuconolactone decarboxylase family protein n=1 Tax=Actinacidiphila glaucinigra TaxID=235986 RepID=UPI0029A10AB0|nr:carboxymuconolactone decarboxylase family protein [Streptomyces sp. PA03-3a]